MHQPMTFRGRFGVVVVAGMIACQVAAPTAAWAHGGGGGHGGGFGGGGGRAMSGGGFGGGGRDFGGGDFRGGDVVGGRPLDGGAARDLGAGRFAGGAGELSRADFQRIANPGVGRDVLGRGAVRPYTANALADRGGMIRNNFYRGGWYGGRGWYGNHFRS